MNRIWKFDFIPFGARVLRALLLLVCAVVAGLSTNCPAQNFDQSASSRGPAYYSQWKPPETRTAAQLAPSLPRLMQADRADRAEQFNLSAPTTTVIETRFQQAADSENSFAPPETVVQEPDAKSVSGLSQMQSTLNDAGKFISGQFGKLFGRTSGNGPDLKRMFGALSLVLGSYFALVWLLRVLSPRSNRQLPTEVIEVLGKTPFGRGQQLQLVRLGSKLLLLLESSEGIQPIAEVSDPAEVHQLLDHCDPFARRAKNRRARPARQADLETQVHSFRIPSVSPEPSHRIAMDSSSPTLADVIRVIENATGTSRPRHRNSYEA